MSKKLILGFATVAVCLVTATSWPLESPGTPPAAPAADTSATDSSTADSPEAQRSASPDLPAGPGTATTAAAATNQPTSLPMKPPFTESLHDNRVVTADNRSFPLRTYRPALTANDVTGSDWWVGNIGLPQVWDVPATSQPTLLAIIDTGFALDHEEFAGRWYNHAGETGPTENEGQSAPNCQDRGLSLSASCNLIDDNYDGIVDNESGPANYQNASRLNCSARGLVLDKSCNRLDDDDNGFIDDARGWDFSHHDPSPQAGELNPGGDGTQHGTYVAGVAAATGNNGRGIAGVDWQTKILPLQALDDDSYGNTLGVARAIRYAADRGADVISLSLGSDQADDYVREAVQYAIARGSLVVAAAGNDGCQCMIYPANYPEVIAVGALSQSNQPASFSSWGANLDILAPGAGLRTTNWTAANPTNAYTSGIGGTSLATPIVSGSLIRLLAQRPGLSPLQATALLTETAAKLTIPASQPRTDSLGYGTLQAHQAVTRLQTARSSHQLDSLTPTSSGGAWATDPPTTASFYICQPHTSTTVLYKLSRQDHTFYSYSPAENYRAVTEGYSSAVLARGCLTLPHDTPTIIRQLNIHREFANNYDKATN